MTCVRWVAVMQMLTCHTFMRMWFPTLVVGGFLHVGVAKDLDKDIADRHQGWLGKLKAWKWKVWQLMADRFEEDSLMDQKYIVPINITPEVPTQKAAKASSSSGLQEVVNAKMKQAESDQSAFPKTERVEAESDAGARPEDEPEKTDFEKAEENMRRWSEMVECVDMLEKINWLEHIANTPQNSADLNIIFREGMNYCGKFMDGVLLPWTIKDWPLNPRVWLGEFERTLKAMALRSCLPYWLKYPHDRNIRDDASESAAGFSDPGNFTLDVMVHCLRLWKYCDASRVEMVIRQSTSEYGSASNKSAKGPVNLRGNIVEAMTKNLQKAGSLPHVKSIPYDPIAKWVKVKHTPPPPPPPPRPKRDSDAGSGWRQQGRSSWQ